jgi:peroxiredoxin
MDESSTISEKGRTMSTTNDLLHVGDAMPALTLPTLDGAPFDLADLNGKKYIVFMWASW